MDKEQAKNTIQKLTEKYEAEKLKEEIARVDGKIDRDIYKLYGLTEEEVKIVEGV